MTEKKAKLFVKKHFLTKKYLYFKTIFTEFFFVKVSHFLNEHA